MPIVRELHARGYVNLEEQPDRVLLSCNQQVHALRVGVLAESTGPLCRIRPDVDATSMTCLELQLSLSAQGWTWHVLPRNTVKRQRLTSGGESPKVWYSYLHPCREYLHLLLCFETLGVDAVPHGQQPKVYKRILEGTPWADIEVEGAEGDTMQLKLDEDFEECPREEVLVCRIGV